MDSKYLTDLVTSCVFDLCALEGDVSQNDFRCSVLEKFNKECLELFEQKNLTTRIYWRDTLNCRMLNY